MYPGPHLTASDVSPIQIRQLGVIARLYYSIPSKMNLYLCILVSSFLNPKKIGVKCEILKANEVYYSGAPAPVKSRQLLGIVPPSYSNPRKILVLYKFYHFPGKL